MPHEVTRHLCRQKACCNPSHLVFGSNTENSNDSIETSKASKLTKKRVREIRESGFPVAKLQKIHTDLSRRTLYRVMNNESWVDV